MPLASRRVNVETMLAAVEQEVHAEDRVLELGCGVGRWTGVLAAQAFAVIAFDPSPVALERAMDRHMGTTRLRFAQTNDDGNIDLEPGSVDLVVAHGLFRRVSSAKTIASYVREAGRALAPGGRAVLALSTDPAAGEPRASRRDLFRLVPRRTEATPGPFVPLDALGAVAFEAGLQLERIEGAGTRETVVLALRS